MQILVERPHKMHVHYILVTYYDTAKRYLGNQLYHHDIKSANCYTNQSTYIDRPCTERTRVTNNNLEARITKSAHVNICNKVTRAST